MFNKTYQSRANRRGDLVSVQEILGELVRKADADPRFYRPPRKPDPRGTARGRRNDRLQGVQLELDFSERDVAPVSNNEKVTPDPQRPLFDLFPEAYQ